MPLIVIFNSDYFLHIRSISHFLSLVDPESSDDDDVYESMDEDNDNNNSDEDNDEDDHMDFDDDSDRYAQSVPGSVRQSTDSIYNDQEEADGFQFEEEDNKKSKQTIIIHRNYNQGQAQTLNSFDCQIRK